MWLWDAQLRALGFKRSAERYWLCEGRHGLPGWAHLSIYSWSEQTLTHEGKKRFRYLVEVTDFHVTFLTTHDNLHFYYHERQLGLWVPGGHTSRAELLRLGEDPLALRVEADNIAWRLVTAWGSVLLPRRRGRRSQFLGPGG